MDFDHFACEASSKSVTVQTQVFSEPKIPYEKVVVTDFCHLECEAWQKSVTVHTMCVQ